MNRPGGLLCVGVVGLGLVACSAEDNQVGTLDGSESGLRVLIEAPPPGPISGSVQITARAEPAELAAAMEVVTPAGLIDVDPAPDRFSAVWDSSTVPDGPLTVVIRATDADGTAAIGQVSVQVENAGEGAVSGRVYAGGWLRGATVEVVGFSGLAEGAVLGTTTTDDIGVFRVPVDIPGYDDLVLLRVSGTAAAYESLRTGEDVALRPGEALVGVVRYTDGKVADATLITPWTTVGVSLARGRLAAQGGSPESAVGWAMGAVREHVFRPEPLARDVRSIPPVNVTSTTGFADQATTAVGLTHAGLEQLASDLSGAGKPVTLLALVAAVARDL